jgi:Pyridoxamine 5'-phosphate oxidase
MQPDATLLVATVDDDGAPRAGRGWVAVDAGHPGRIRVVVGADDPAMVANLRPGARIAVTSGDVRTLRSTQVKGRVDTVGPTSDDDLTAMAGAVDGFVRAVHEVDGNPPEQLRRLLPNAVLAVEIDVDEVFDQSPGPGAGSRRT